MEHSLFRGQHARCEEADHPAGCDRKDNRLYENSPSKGIIPHERGDVKQKFDAIFFPRINVNPRGDHPEVVGT